MDERRGAKPSTFREFDAFTQRFRERLKPQVTMRVKGETLVFRVPRRTFQQMFATVGA